MSVQLYVCVCVCGLCTLIVCMYMFTSLEATSLLASLHKGSLLLCTSALLRVSAYCVVVVGHTMYLH